jgi:hypothetical protein
MSTILDRQGNGLIAIRRVAVSFFFVAASTILFISCDRQSGFPVGSMFSSEVGCNHYIFLNGKDTVDWTAIVMQVADFGGQVPLNDAGFPINATTL